MKNEYSTHQIWKWFLTKYQLMKHNLFDWLWYIDRWIIHSNFADVSFDDKRLKWHLEELCLLDEIYLNLCVFLYFNGVDWSLISIRIRSLFFMVDSSFIWLISNYK